MPQKHKRFVLILFYITSALFFRYEISAQDIPEVRVKLSPLLEQGLEVVYPSDFDILNRNVATYCFDVEIWNVIQDWENTRVILRVEQNGVPIMTAESDPFTLPEPDPPPPPLSPAYTASNIDLMNLMTIPGTGILFHFNKKNIDLPDKDFEQTLFASGKVERGNYFLIAILDNPAWGFEEVKSEIRLIITNPSLVRLQSPMNEEVINTEFPFFQFESDATNFMVYVYKRRNENDDIETVLSGHPTLEYATSLKQFSYDITEGDPLESGATYYWFVKALVHTTHGLEDFSSRVWQFTMSIEGGPGGELDLKQLLEPLLGDQAESIANSLSGYNLTTIKVNGETITLEELYQIISQYSTGRLLIQDLILQ